jgi:hypothetical protein
VNKKISNSVGNIRGLFPWFAENVSFLLMRLKGLKSKETELACLLKEIDVYAEHYNAITGRNLADANILEIGYGARPNRLLALISLGYDVKGIDLDKPILKPSIAEYLKNYQKNGFKRVFKSLARSLLFDSHERAALDRVLQGRGARLNLDESRFLVGDASTFKFHANSIDFIYSEDVFEHISPDAIHALCKNLNEAMSFDGLALISPSIYSGIAGGHLVEWYPHTLKKNSERQSEPWEHLRKRRFVADCYLNELRVSDFESIFMEYFQLIDVINRNSGLGREYLTKEIKDELSQFSEKELLSNKWTFVLRKKCASKS